MTKRIMSLGFMLMFTFFNGQNKSDIDKKFEEATKYRSGYYKKLLSNTFEYPMGWNKNNLFYYKSRKKDKIEFNIINPSEKAKKIMHLRIADLFW